ncbi:hypothetical protein CO046_04735 [Candidatus Peregrinibacteria bacterium CG_4_9_14_0_2_um_filter_53_11]|nr:MAG: hypothetical protein CO046_04735 [Candidatus Peregrinibacteria bacterium CG_4_9_14_0_2_um_filter_53_11]
MLTSLIYALILETFDSSYGTVAATLPPQIVAQGYAQNSVLTLGENRAVPEKITRSLGPVVEAAAVFSVELESGTPLLSTRIFDRRAIASITKLVTAMVILDNHKLDEVLTVSNNAAGQEGSRMWLKTGEEIRVEEAMRGLLISSGNDAAVALAEYDAGSEEAFVKKMNDKAQALGLKNTHFSNSKGFDSQYNYSTAFDVMVFSRAAFQYPFIRESAHTQSLEVQSADGSITHKLETTDELLGDSDFAFRGLKTGTTPLAGESFVSVVELYPGHTILTVVLGSRARFKETKIILDWIRRNYSF